jgi:hypothetical protein
MLNEAKRHKHGQMPGDICRKGKIRLKERRRLAEGPYNSNEDSDLSREHAQGFRRMMKQRSLARQRLRNKRASQNVEGW